jgi:hypothetical protein
MPDTKPQACPACGKPLRIVCDTDGECTDKDCPFSRHTIELALLRRLRYVSGAAPKPQAQGWEDYALSYSGEHMVFVNRCGSRWYLYNAAGMRGFMGFVYENGSLRTVPCVMADGELEFPVAVRFSKENP